MPGTSPCKQKKMADLEIKSYTNAKQVLDRHNISINEDLPKFANAISRIEEYGYDLKRLIAELKYIQYLDRKKQALEITYRRIGRAYCEPSSARIYVARQDLFTFGKSTLYNQLADMGFSSSQLKTLLDKIINIAISNGINHWLGSK